MAVQVIYGDKKEFDKRLFLLYKTFAKAALRIEREENLRKV
jgi:hypothetical protein